MSLFSKEQLRNARLANLYNFIELHHMDTHIKEGQCLRPCDNHSLSIKAGYSGYKDFATDETGNSIDYLVRYLGYTIKEAVLALSNEVIPVIVNNDVKQINTVSSVHLDAFVKMIIPEPTNGPYKQLFAYLNKRGIPTELIQILINQGLLYQSKDYNNIVFINEERDWAELRGTYTYCNKPFHGIAKNSRADGFWSFKTAEETNIAYVCESAIDAISLFLLQKQNASTEDACYISTGGCAKQPAIERIKNKHMKVILAVDNDKAGEKSRQRNPDLAALIPIKKDWNEDWIEYLKGSEDLEYVK